MDKSNVSHALTLFEKAQISMSEEGLNKLLREIPTLETTITVSLRNETRTLLSTSFGSDGYYRREVSLAGVYSAFRSEVEQIVHDFGYSVVDGTFVKTKK